MHLRDENPRGFALRAGLDPSHLYQILRGERKHVRQETMAKLADACGMSLTELTAQIEGPKPRRVPRPDETIDPREVELNARTATFEQTLRGVPRQFWSTYLDACISLGRAYHGAPFSTPSEVSVSAQSQPLNQDGENPSDDLVGGKVPWSERVAARAASQRQLVRS